MEKLRAAIYLFDSLSIAFSNAATKGSLSFAPIAKIPILNIFLGIPILFIVMVCAFLGLVFGGISAFLNIWGHVEDGIKVKKKGAASNEGYTAKQTKEYCKSTEDSYDGPDKTGWSLNQKNAYKAAIDWIKSMPKSEKGLVERLIADGYSKQDAEFVVGCMDVNWDEQAVRYAKETLEYNAKSRSGMIEYLMFDGFTEAQAKHAVREVGYEDEVEENADSEKQGCPINEDWSVSQQNAVRVAQEIIQSTPFSKKRLIRVLEDDGFPTLDSEFAVEQIQVDWSEMVSREAKEMVESTPFSRRDLIFYLQDEGYTEQQAKLGADYVGLLETESERVISELTPEQQSAVECARRCLRDRAYSKPLLLKMLTELGHEESVSEFAFDFIGIDWYEQARDYAEGHMIDNYSRQDMQKLLEVHGFTEAQATYAVDSTGL